MQKQLNEQLQMQEQLEQLETLAKAYMSPEAISRYGTLKSAHLEKAIQSLVIITQLVQQGTIKEKITDDQYKDLLLRLSPQKKEFKITKK
jgi:programmed cell death protein 5